MKRRAFLAALFAAPAAAKAAGSIDVSGLGRHTSGEDALASSRARVGSHVVRPFTSPNGRMILDFSAGTITIRG